MNQTEPFTFKGFPFIGYWSDRGRMREENEDSFYVPPQTLDPQLLQSKGYLCIVADGMGGHAKGEVASQIAARRIAEEYYADPNPDPEQSLRRAIQIANSEIYATAQQPGMTGMGTTVVAAVSIGNRLIVANAGDSRAYLISQGQAVRITRDHSWVQDRVEAGVLTEEQARQHAQKNLITRALGSKPQVEVDVFKPAAEAGDLVLLCSDGLSNMVRPEEIVRAVTKLPPQVAAKRLVARANGRGGPDNITAVIMPMGGEAGAVPVLPRQVQTPMLLPVAAMVGVLLVMVMAFAFALRAQNLANSQAQTAIAMALPALTSTISPTMLPPVTKTVTAMATHTPTATRTLTPIPTPTAMHTPTATNTAIQPPTAVPGATSTPAAIQTPPAGELHYAVQSGDTTPKLTRYFYLTDDPAKQKEFYEAHREIWCTPPDPITRCIKKDAVLIVAWKEVLDKLNPIGLSEMQENHRKPIWLVVRVDNRLQSIPGLNWLLQRYKDHPWALVRGIGQQGGFNIEPDNFVFVLEGQVYAQQ